MENEQLGEKFIQLCRMTDEMIKRMPAWQRDRMLQVHLAAARGASRNFNLLCEMTDTFAEIRRERMRVAR